MIESNKPAFNDEENHEGENHEGESHEGESQPENKNREAKPPGIEYGDCVFVKSGMLTFKLENGDEASIMLIEDEWPSTNVVESVEKDGDCRFVSFDSTDVEIQVLRRHMMDASTDLTIPQTP
jgi:hypothetical protein